MNADEFIEFNKAFLGGGDDTHLSKKMLEEMLAEGITLEDRNGIPFINAENWIGWNKFPAGPILDPQEEV